MTDLTLATPCFGRMTGDEDEAATALPATVSEAAVVAARILADMVSERNE
jgi:hypothetical protein